MLNFSLLIIWLIQKVIMATKKKTIDVKKEIKELMEIMIKLIKLNVEVEDLQKKGQELSDYIKKNSSDYKKA